VGSAWKILLVTACSLWSVLGGGGRESPVKHGAGGASMGGGGGTGGKGPGGGGGARVGKDRAGGSSTGALCTGFTLVLIYCYIVQDFVCHLIFIILECDIKGGIATSLIVN
jgi:hypothetical protein